MFLLLLHSSHGYSKSFPTELSFSQRAFWVHNYLLHEENMYFFIYFFIFRLHDKLQQFSIYLDALSKFYHLRVKSNNLDWYIRL